MVRNRIHQEASPAYVQQATLEGSAKPVRLRFRLDLFIVFSERELKFMIAICHRPSVCLSVVCNVRASYSDD